MRKLLLYSLLIIASKSLFASDLDLSVSGFGHLGWAVSDESIIGYRSGITTNTNTKDRHLESKIDSLLGLQLNATLSENVNAGAQFVLKDRFDDDKIGDHLQLGYLAFKPHAQVELRGGRLGLPIYMLSDHRDVGFSYLWDRPITEFYGMMPFRSFDGIDVTFKQKMGAGLAELILFYGDASVALPGNTIPLLNLTENNFFWDFQVKDFYGIVPKYEQENWRFQLAAAQAKVAVPFISIPSLDTALAQARAGLPPPSLPFVDALEAEYIDSVNVKGTMLYYYSLGMAYDNNDWVIQSEISRLRAQKGFLSNSHSAYLSVGRRIGKWTPYTVYSFIEPEKELFRSAVPRAALGPASILVDGAEAITNVSHSKQHSIAIGARWDIHPNVSLKMQWTHYRVDKNGAALWSGDLGTLPSDIRADVQSLGMSSIF